MRFLLLIVILFVAFGSYSQNLKPYYSTLNYLLINNNARSAAFGDIQVVASEQYYASGLNYNPANLSKGLKVLGTEFFFPIVHQDITKYNIGGYYGKHENITYGYFLDYFEYTRNYAKSQADLLISTRFNYRLFYHTFRIALPLKKDRFLGIGIKHISNTILMGPHLTNADWILKINSLALDVGMNKRKKVKINSRFSYGYQTGFALLNLGPKVDSLLNLVGDKAFIPGTAQAGILGTINLLGGNNVCMSVDIAYQLEKYLVPSTPEYDIRNGEVFVTQGYNPDVSYFKGVMQSFYDSPEGFSGEMREYIHKFGCEIRINNNQKYFAALRFGYVTGEEILGLKHFNTIGFRAGAYGFYLDFSSIPEESIIYSKLNIGIILNLYGNKLMFDDDLIQ